MPLRKLMLGPRPREVQLIPRRGCRPSGSSVPISPSAWSGGHPAPRRQGQRPAGQSIALDVAVDALVRSTVPPTTGSVWVPASSTTRALLPVTRSSVG